MSTFELIEPWEADCSPTMWEVVGTGRAKCRVCGDKVPKGENCWAFFATFTDSGHNPWTCVETKAHKNCLGEHGRKY